MPKKRTLSVKAIISAAIAAKNEATTGQLIVVAVSLLVEESLGALTLVEELLEAPPLDALLLAEALSLAEVLLINSLTGK